MRVGVAHGTAVDGTVAVGVGAPPRQALQWDPVWRWRPRLLITAAITATALTPMATAYAYPYQRAYYGAYPYRRAYYGYGYPYRRAYYAHPYRRHVVYGRYGY